LTVIFYFVLFFDNRILRNTLGLITPEMRVSYNRKSYLTEKYIQMVRKRTGRSSAAMALKSLAKEMKEVGEADASKYWTYGMVPDDAGTADSNLAAKWGVSETMESGKGQQGVQEGGRKPQQPNGKKRVD
jgi:hypothetical protein